MAKGEKVLVLGRHGKHKDNILVPEAIKQAYNFGQSLREKYFPRGISSKNILMLHSGQPRAEDTGKSILTGISNIQLPPNSQKDLERLSEDGFFDKFIISRAALLGYDHLDFNDDEIDADEEKYMKIWAADPDSTDFKGKYITCYNEMIRRGQAFLVDEINEMISNKYRLGLFPSHLSIVEQIFTAGINSARDTLLHLRILEEYLS